MNIKLILNISRIVVSLLLIAVILLGSKGVGLSTAFGGEGSFYRSKRGVEKILFILTIIFGIIFALLSLLGVLVS